MDKKIKLLVVTSMVAVMATGCSRFSGGTNSAVDGSDGYTETGSSSQMSGSSQVGGNRGAIFSQQRSSATCAPCAANNTQKAQTTTTQAPRVYKPAATTVAKPYVQPQGQHSQQWYVERWKRQQQAQGQNGTQNTANYNAGTAGSNATYYDYSTAGGANANSGVAAGTANTNVSTSNKSIYTGSYQQKTYKPYNPTTYSGGSAATTNTNTTYVSNATNTASTGGSTYIVKKGDTVFEIMRQTGVYWKDIIKLNNLQAPAYNINPGQTIRLK